jgi:hypothetical protein
MVPPLVGQIADDECGGVTVSEFRPRCAGRHAGVIADVGREGDRFRMDGGGWANVISWVRGYVDHGAELARRATGIVADDL